MERHATMPQRPAPERLDVSSADFGPPMDASSPLRSRGQPGPAATTTQTATTTTTTTTSSAMLLTNLLAREQSQATKPSAGSNGSGAASAASLTHGRTRAQELTSRADSSSERFLEELARVQGRLHTRLASSSGTEAAAEHAGSSAASTTATAAGAAEAAAASTYQHLSHHHHIAPPPPPPALPTAEHNTSPLRMSTLASGATLLHTTLSHPTVAALVQREREVVLEEFRRELAQMDQERTRWKVKELEQMRVVQACLLERDALKRSELQRDHELAIFKEEISRSVETLTTERQRWTEASRTKDAQVSELQRNYDTLTLDLSEERERRIQLEQEHESLSRELARATRELELQNENKARLKKELDDLRAEQEQQRSSLAERAVKDTQTVADLKAQVRSLEATNHRLETEMETIRREREGLKTEISLLQTRHATEQAKHETTLKTSIEREVTRRVAEEHERAAATEAKLKEAHRQQIQQLTQRHREETEETITRCQRDVERKNEQIASAQHDYERQIRSLQDQLGHAQASIAGLTRSLHNREHQRTEQLGQLEHQLQDTLRSQFDAVSRVAKDLTAASKSFSEDTRAALDEIADQTLRHSLAHDMSSFVPAPRLQPTAVDRLAEFRERRVVATTTTTTTSTSAAATASAAPTAPGSADKTGNRRPYTHMSEDLAQRLQDIRDRAASVVQPQPSLAPAAAASSPGPTIHSPLRVMWPQDASTPSPQHAGNVHAGNADQAAGNRSLDEIVTHPKRDYDKPWLDHSHSTSDHLSPDEAREQLPSVQRLYKHLEKQRAERDNSAAAAAAAEGLRSPGGSQKGGKGKPVWK